MIEVFKTNVNDGHVADDIIQELLHVFPGYKINFDLEDCDKILRVESVELISCEVVDIVKRKGFLCEALE